jgi:hypothetical protein
MVAVDLTVLWIHFKAVAMVMFKVLHRWWTSADPMRSVHVAQAKDNREGDRFLNAPSSISHAHVLSGTVARHYLD